VAVFEPEIIEVVGETGKGTVGVHPFVAGGGTGVRDVLEVTFDIEAKIVVDQEFESCCKLRGEFPIAPDRFLVRPVSGVGIDHSGPSLNVRNNDPVGLDEVISDDSGDAGHVGSESFPDIRTRDFKDSFEIAAERGIAKRVFLIVRRDEHPAEADIILLIVENRFVWAETAGGEHHAGHIFQGDPVFDKESRGKITGVGHRRQASWGIRCGQVVFGNRGRTALLHLGKERQSCCE